MCSVEESEPVSEWLVFVLQRETGLLDVSRVVGLTAASFELLGFTVPLTNAVTTAFDSLKREDLCIFLIDSYRSSSYGRVLTSMGSLEDSSTMWYGFRSDDFA